MTQPYYADEHVTLYHGDCREVTEWLEADVLVTDPPYGIAWRINPKDAKGTGRREGIVNDADTSARDAALAAWGSERPGLVFGSWRQQVPEFKHVLVWRKPSNAGVLGAFTGWRRDTELIFLVGRWPVVGPRNGSSVLTTDHAASAYLNEHSHAKPVALIERLMIGCPTGVVADPFAGSGTTLYAAKRQGRKAIGVEIDERYCEIAARRLDQGVLDFDGLALADPSP